MSPLSLVAALGVSHSPLLTISRPEAKARERLRDAGSCRRHLPIRGVARHLGPPRLPRARVAWVSRVKSPSIRSYPRLFPREGFGIEVRGSEATKLSEYLEYRRR